MTQGPKHWRGFGPGVLTFFSELDANNRRDWFLAHKEHYERTIKAPLMDLVADLSTALADRDVPLFGDPKRALFRLNRDVRFSHDKRPYKTVASAVLSRDGEKRSAGVLYLHFSPQACFVAVGFYQPEPQLLAAMRARILARGAEWRAMLAQLESEGLPLERGDTAARLPRGIDAAEAGTLAPDLKLRSFVVLHKLSPAETTEPSLVATLADIAVRARPLLDFGWSALTDRA